MYPKYVATKTGFEAIVNDGVKLPGIFLSQWDAERAVKRYQGKSVEAKAERKRGK